jgi:hypothetical protein
MFGQFACAFPVPVPPGGVVVAEDPFDVELDPEPEPELLEEEPEVSLVCA